MNLSINVQSHNLRFHVIMRIKVTWHWKYMHEIYAWNFSKLIYLPCAVCQTENWEGRKRYFSFYQLNIINSNERGLMLKTIHIQQFKLAYWFSIFLTWFFKIKICIWEDFFFLLECDLFSYDGIHKERYSFLAVLLMLQFCQIVFISRFNNE